MFDWLKCYPLILVELRKGRKAGFREVEQRIRYLSVAFSKAGERLQKASLRLSENVEKQDFEELSEVFVTYPLPFSGR